MTTARDLKNINNVVRHMILDYMSDHDMTLNAFCKEANIHQAQMWVFMNSGTDGKKQKSLSTNTIQKIGSFLSKQSSK